MSIHQILDLSTAFEPTEQYRPAPERLISGDPLQQIGNTYSSPCGRFSSGIWECTPGHWRVNYSEYEYCEIISGLSVLHDAQGGQKVLKAGDRFVIPAGFVGSWEVRETCRKRYVIFDDQAG
jgi:uncharacterized cupin superfamily protein